MSSIFSEFKNKVLKGFFGKWLDFRPFLSQRREIMNSENLNFNKRKKESPNKWKLPLEFGIQGLVLCTFIVTITGAIFSTFVKERPLILMEVIRESKSASLVPKHISPKEYVSERIKLSENYIAILDKELEYIKQSTDSVFAKPIPYSNQDNHTLFILSVALSMDSLKKDDAILAYKSELTKLEYRKSILEWQKSYEKTYSKLKYFVIPFSLLLASFIFKALMRRRVVNKKLQNELPSQYLFFFTAFIFWINFFQSIIQSIKLNVDKYFPPQMNQIVSDLESSLNNEFINHKIGLYINGLLFVVSIILIMVGIGKIKTMSNKMSYLYNLKHPELAISSKQIFWKTIWSNVLSYAIVVSTLLLLTFLVNMIEPIIDSWKV